MNNKYKVLQTYALLAIDMICVVISYVFFSWLRYNNNNDWGDKTLHYMVCVVFLLFCVIFTFLADWNRDFIIRGYVKELFAVIRATAVMLVGSVVVVFFLQWTNILSRFVVGNFIWMDILLTYVARVLFKEFLRRHISSEKNVQRVVVISEKALMEKTIKKLVERGSGVGYKVVRAYCAD